MANHSQLYAVLALLSERCPPPKGRLSTCYAPVRHCTRVAPFSCDLHVLSVPLTFALSQDQTLQLKTVERSVQRLTPDPVSLSTQTTSAVLLDSLTLSRCALSRALACHSDSVFKGRNACRFGLTMLRTQRLMCKPFSFGLLPACFAAPRSLPWGGAL